MKCLFLSLRGAERRSNPEFFCTIHGIATPFRANLGRARNDSLEYEKKVMIFGTFDIFHAGHKNFFRQSREHGEYLIVVVARDKNVLKAKGRLPQNNEIDRLKKISESKLADIVILGDLDNKYKVIQKFKPDVICVGYDQEYSAEELKEKLVEFGFDKTQIIRLNPFHPEKYKSSKLRR